MVTLGTRARRWCFGALGLAVLGCARTERTGGEATSVGAQPLTKSATLLGGIIVREVGWQVASADKVEVRVVVINPTKAAVTLNATRWSLRTIDGVGADLAADLPAKASVVRIEPNSQWRGSLVFATKAIPLALRADAVDIALAPLVSAYPSTSVVAR